MTPGRFLLAWGAWLTALAALLAIWSPGSATPLLLLAATVPAIAAALLAWRHPKEPRERLVSDSSVGTVLIAVGASVALLGTTAGLWLALVGGEICAFGLALLARELRAMRRAAKGDPDPEAPNG